MPYSKPLRPRLVGDHPLGVRAGLVRALAFSEGGGVPVEIVNNAVATATNAPTWTVGAFGYARNYVSGSSQTDAIPWTESNGATRFTLIARLYRASTSDAVHVGRFDSNSNRTHVTWNNDGTMYFVVSNAASAQGRFANTLTGWHHIALVYDGSQSGNANRLKGYVDGIPQTLNFSTDTIPATAASLTSTLQVGGLITATLYSTGQADGVWCYNTALSDGQIADHYARPFSMFRMPSLRQSVFFPDFRSPQPTASSSNYVPTPDSTRETSRLVNVSVDWTPRNVLNPVDSVTISLNGTALDVTETSVGGGVVRATATGVVRGLERAGVIRSSCFTQDGVENTTLWSFTARRLYDVDAFTDEFVPTPSPTPFQTDYMLRPFAPVDGLTDYGTSFSTGLRAATDETIEYAPQDALNGLLHSVDNLTDVLVVQEVKAPLAPISTNIGEFGQQPFPVGFLMRGYDHTRFPVGTAVSGTDRADLLPASVNIGDVAKTGLLAIAAGIGAFGQHRLPVGVAINPYFAAALLEYVVATTGLQDAEEAG